MTRASYADVLDALPVMTVIELAHIRAAVEALLPSPDWQRYLSVAHDRSPQDDLEEVWRKRHAIMAAGIQAAKRGRRKSKR